MDNPNLNTGPHATRERAERHDSMQTTRSGGSSALWFIVGGVVVALGIVAYVMSGGTADRAALPQEGATVTTGNGETPADPTAQPAPVTEAPAAPSAPEPAPEAAAPAETAPAETAPAAPAPAEGGAATGN